MRAVGPSGLLERSSEVAALRALADDTAAGWGRVVVIEGEAGIGKTRLVQLAGEAAADRGLVVARARARRLETVFAFGLARQLLERPLLDLPADVRREVLAAAASPAAPILGLDPSVGDPPPLPNACHALYWVAERLAHLGPLMLLVDDFHWGDEPSLQWLLHLAHRMEGLPIGLVVASRTGEQEAAFALLQELEMQPVSTVLRPRPLSAAAVHEWLERSVGQADEAFAVSCHCRTAGNPFLLGEIVDAVASEGLRPSTESLQDLERLRPERVQQDVAQRLTTLPADVRAVAEAAAVLGPDATLSHLGELAALPAARVAEAADRLTAMRLLSPGVPLEFVHALVADAVLHATPSGRRDQLRRRAARTLLRNQTVDLLPRAAAHLLASAPAGEEWAARALANAAGVAMRMGDAQTAVACLERALAEPAPSTDRPEILRELGRARLAAGGQDALACLREAQGALGTGDVDLARLIASAAATAGRLEEAAEALRATLAALPPDAHEERLQLEGEIAALVVFGLEPSEEIVGHLARLAEGADGRTRGERSVLAGAGFLLAQAGWPIETCAELAQRAILGGLLADQTADAPALYLALDVMLDAERYDTVREVLDEALVDAQQRASILGFVHASSFRAYLEWFAGDLPRATAVAADVLNATREAGMAGMSPGAVAVLTDAFTEQGDFVEANRVLDDQELTGPLPESALYNPLLFARGNLRIAEGRLETALEDFAELDRRDLASGRAGLVFLWRSSAARALAARAEQARAVELARAEQERAARGGPRPRGVALCALGVALGGEEGIEALQQSVGLLAASPARLEHARALVHLGAALRRSNRRGAGAAALREGLRFAETCEAHALADLAREELRASGAKARRLLLSGAASLTPSERRVAMLARDGLGNVEIAQRLFVTRKTVETHLSRAYDKLGIRSRHDLAGALGGPQDGEEAVVGSGAAEGSGS